MNKQQLALQRTKVYKSYHVPNMPNYARRKVNAIFFNPSNSKRHELKKAEVCYDLLSEGKQFVTEAVDNKTGLRRDVICLDTGIVYEIETTVSRSLRHKNDKNVEVVMVDV